MYSQFPRLIDWAITPACNLNCRHCRGMAQGELSTDVALGLIDQIAELKPGWVIIEGGEPLLRKDLAQLLERMQQKNLSVHLITNGTLLTDSTLDTLKKLGTNVMVSIDGATTSTYEKIRHGASFEQVLDRASAAAEKGLLEAFNFTVMKANYTEIPELFELAKQTGLNRVTIIGLKPCHGFTDQTLSPKEYLEAIQLACEGSYKTGVDFFFDEPFFNAVVKEKGFPVRVPEAEAGILDSSTPACIFGEYMFIEPNGDVKPCSFAAMVLGNVKEKPLGSIWQEILTSPFFEQIKQPESRKGRCLSCRHLPDCRGCRSRTFILTDDWLESDPCCPL